MPYEMNRNLFCIPVGDSIPVDDHARRWLDECYRRMKRDGTLSDVFFGEVPPDEELFRRFADDPSISLFLIFTGDGKPETLAGFFWLVHKNPGCCYVHQCFFKEVWGAAKGMAGVIIDQLLDHYLVIRGATPETNRTGLALVKRLGFTILGTVPDAAFLSEENRNVGLVESYIRRSNLKL